MSRLNWGIVGAVVAVIIGGIQIYQGTQNTPSTTNITNYHTTVSSGSISPLATQADKTITKKQVTPASTSVPPSEENAGLQQNGTANEKDIHKGSYSGRDVAVNTAEGIVSNVLNRSKTIEVNLYEVNKLGNSKGDLVIKKINLTQVVDAANYIERNSKHIRGLVSGNPSLGRALSYANNKSNYINELRKVEKMLASRSTND